MGKSDFLLDQLKIIDIELQITDVAPFNSAVAVWVPTVWVPRGSHALSST